MPNTSVLAWEKYHVVGEIELDLLKRKIREWNRLGIHNVAVTVVARQDAFAIANGELPELERFTSRRATELLRQGDLIQ